MTHRTIAVIGHVDHGKTSLVKAMTGVETDTLKEEQARGLTISLGFASRATQTGHLHFIDAPGHADFARTTASGISGANGVLLVVSAREGIEPQTLEHMKLAYHFGLRHVLVAVTKSDLVNDEIKTSRIAAVTTLLDQFSLESSSVTPCSSKTGDGINTLVQRLEKFSQIPISRPHFSDIYLPIDRVFSAPGAGTVVTGTLVAGPMEKTETVRVEPAGLESSIRGLQIAGKATSLAPIGARVAVNIRNVDAKSIRKGDVLCGAGKFQGSDRFDVSIQHGDDPGRALKHMQQVMVLIGTSAVSARLRLYRAADETAPSASVLAQFEFKTPQIAFPGQRFVTRNPASAETLTGGIILDPNARLITRNRRAHLSVLEATLAQDAIGIADALAERDRGCIDLDTLSRLSVRPIEALPDLIGARFELNTDGLAFRSKDVCNLQRQYTETLTTLHAARPCLPNIPEDQIHATLRPAATALVTRAETNLLKVEAIRMGQNGVALIGHKPLAAMSCDQLNAYHDAEERLSDMALQPVPVFAPDVQTPEQNDLLELLIWEGRALRFYNHSLKQSFLLHIDSINASHRTLSEAFPGATSFTTGDAREALKTNRKTIIPLLEHLDQLGATQRTGNLRHLVQRDAPFGACAGAPSD